ncbi:MAG: SIMPL domain-containing protein [Pyrinomonadaceae bacterium]
MTRNILRALMACSFLLVHVSFATAQDDRQSPRLITVSGSAEIRVQPNEVVFNIEIENLDKDIVVAKRANDEGVKKVLALAHSYQIESQNIKTDYISVEPRYSTDLSLSTKPREFLGYEVSKTVVIRLTDLSRFESLFSDALRAGVNRVYGVEFLTTEIRKHKDQARALAIKAAQEKAIALAREIGQKIGKAYSINESSESSGGGSAMNNLYVSESGTGDSQSTFALGQITVNARVTVSFELD